MVIKKCVGFFFLFFLNGTSIGTRQQGISYNTKIIAIALSPHKQGKPIFTNC